jgi:hypothetical protein
MEAGMTDQRKGRYAGVIQSLREGLRALEAVANMALAEKDAEIASLTEERDRYRAALVVISGSSDQLQALQAACALDNIGPPTKAV